MFAEVQLIDRKSWCKKIVYVPQMLEHLGEWEGRRKREETPELLLSHSGETQ